MFEKFRNVYLTADIMVREIARIGYMGMEEKDRNYPIVLPVYLVEDDRRKMITSGEVVEKTRITFFKNGNEAVIEFDPMEAAMSLDDFSKRYLEKAAKELYTSIHP